MPRTWVCLYTSFDLCRIELVSVIDVDGDDIVLAPAHAAPAPVLLGRYDQGLAARFDGQLVEPRLRSARLDRNLRPGVDAHDIGTFDPQPGEIGHRDTAGCRVRGQRGGGERQGEQGFDAGLRFGEMIAQDMIAVPIGPRQRSAIVASPAFFERYPIPTAPEQLKALPCVRFRFDSGRFYAWEFERGGIELSVEVDGPLTLGDQSIMVQAALDGAGLAYAFEDQVTELLAAGRWPPRAGARGLVPLLCRVLPLLSRPPASAGGAPRLHRFRARGRIETRAVDQPRFRHHCIKANSTRKKPATATLE